MAIELPRNTTELLAFLNAHVEVLIPQDETPSEESKSELAEVLQRAREAGDYLDNLLHGKPIDRIIIIESPIK